MDDRDRQLAEAYSWARIGLGAAALVAPKVAWLWLGAEARRPTTRALAKGLGARDLVVGVGGLAALRAGRDDELVRWLWAAAAVDAADALATAKAVPHLPRRSVLMVAAAAAGAVLGAALAGSQKRS